MINFTDMSKINAIDTNAETHKTMDSAVAKAVETFAQGMNLEAAEVDLLTEHHLDQSLFDGLHHGKKEMDDGEEERTFSDKVNKLLDTDGRNTSEAQVNVPKSQVEMEIIGYLLGRKIAKKNARYVPKGIDVYHTLPLRSLNQIATKAYYNFQPGEKISGLNQISHFLARLRKS